MNATQLLERVQFVVDGKGQQSAVLLNMEDWEQAKVELGLDI
jgi:hypothetical protein